MIKSSFCGLTISDIDKLVTGLGYDHSHSVKVASNFYRRGIHDFQAMNNIPKQLRNSLDAFFSSGVYPPVSSEISGDLSEKHLFRNISGKAYETVIIPERSRRTVCVSTQSGCRMGCPFCLTGKSGFRGDLTSGEIVNQVLSVPDARAIDHVVFMGMGEPMDNLEEVLKSCEILSAGWGLAISPGKITVSTVGITAAVKKFLEGCKCNLVLSLFSPFPAERAEVVPAERKYPASEIIAMMKEFPARKNRRFSIAYVMIDGVNDTVSHLEALAALVKGTSIRINLLPYHNVPGDRFASSPDGQIKYFKDSLTGKGVSVSIRMSRGKDISAACGLLASGLRRGEKR